MDTSKLLQTMAASARRGLDLDNYGRSLVFSKSIGVGAAQVVHDQWIEVRENDGVYWVSRQIDGSDPSDYRLMAESEARVTPAQAASLIERWLCDATQP